MKPAPPEMETHHAIPSDALRDEAAWPKLSKAEQEQGMAAYMAYTEALTTAGALVRGNRLRPERGGDDGADRQRQVAGARWPLRPTRRNSSAAITSSTWPTSMPRSLGGRCPAAGHGVVEVRPIWEAAA